MFAMVAAGDRFTARREGARLRLLRAAHRARLVAVGLHPGDHGRRGRSPRAGLRLLRRGRADGPRRPRAQHARRAAHGVDGGLVAGRGGRLRRVSATTPASSRSTRGCRRTSSAWSSASCSVGAGCAWRSCRARRATSWSTARRSSCATMTRRSRSSAAVRRRIRGAPGRRRGAAAAAASHARAAAAAGVRLTAGAVLRWIDRGLPPPQARRKTLPGPRLRGVFLVRPRP